MLSHDRTGTLYLDPSVCSITFVIPITGARSKPSFANCLSTLGGNTLGIYCVSRPASYFLLLAPAAGKRRETISRGVCGVPHVLLASHINPVVSRKAAARPNPLLFIYRHLYIHETVQIFNERWEIFYKENVFYLNAITNRLKKQ